MYSLLSFLCIFCEVYTETSFAPLLATGYSSSKTWFVVLQSNSNIANFEIVFKQNSEFFAKMKNSEV